MLARDFTQGDRVAFLGTDVAATVVAVYKDRIDVRRDDGLPDTLYDHAGWIPRISDIYRLPHPAPAVAE